MIGIGITYLKHGSLGEGWVGLVGMMVKVIQGHHIIYDNKEGQEVVVPVFKGEHKICTLMQWYTKGHVSKGFIKALKVFIVLNEDRAEVAKSE